MRATALLSVLLAANVQVHARTQHTQTSNARADARPHKSTPARCPHKSTPTRCPHKSTHARAQALGLLPCSTPLSPHWDPFLCLTLCCEPEMFLRVCVQVVTAFLFLAFLGGCVFLSAVTGSVQAVSAPRVNFSPLVRSRGSSEDPLPYTVPRAATARACNGANMTKTTKGALGGSSSLVAKPKNCRAM